MRSFVLLCVSQLFSACTGDVVFTLGHADAQPCTMYNCFFVRLAAAIMHGPLKFCLHDVARKRVGSEFRAQRRKAPGACVCYCLLSGLGWGGTVGAVLSLLGILSLDWNFWPFLGMFRDLRKSMKMCKMNYFSLFWKSYLVLFLTFITALWFYVAPLV